MQGNEEIVLSEFLQLVITSANEKKKVVVILPLKIAFADSPP